MKGKKFDPKNVCLSLIAYNPLFYLRRSTGHVASTRLQDGRDEPWHTALIIPLRHRAREDS